MNVLVAVHHFPPTHLGGAEREAFGIARGLQARGHAVRVLCVDPTASTDPSGPSWRDDRYEGLAVRRLAFVPTMAFTAHPTWEYDNPWIGERLREYIEEDRPDVFHLIGGYLISARALVVARALGIPRVVSLTDFWFLCPRVTFLRSDGRLSDVPPVASACAQCLGEERRRYRWLGRVAPRAMAAFWRWRGRAVQRVERRTAFLRDNLAQTDAIVCRSAFVRSTFVASGFDPGRMVTIRQGCDFAGTGVARAPEGDLSVLRVGYVGQIVWLKGVHVLFEAVGRLLGAALSVRAYGDPTAQPAYAATLRRMAARDSRLQLGGVLRSRDEVSRAYRDLDVLVVPSLWYEISPTVILEAFAHGKPVIGSNLGGIRELVRDQIDGLLFDRGSAESLARQLRRLVEEPGLRWRLASGVPRVRSVSDDVDDLEAVYRRASGIGPPR